MKILFLADGPSVHTQKWINFFSAKGHVIDLITFRPSHQKNIHRIYYIDVGEIKSSGNNFQYIFAIPKILKILMSNRYDAVVAHYATSYGFLTSLLKKHFYLVVHGSDIKLTPQKNIFYYFLTGFVLRRASFIFSVAHHITQDLNLSYKIPLNKIHTAQYGVNLQKFINKKPLKDRKYHIVTNRSFIPNSNYPFFIEIIARLKVKFPEIQVLIFGDGPLKNKIQKLIQRFELQNNVELLSTQTEEEVIRLLNDSKIFVSLTSSDGTSLSLLEAMACGNFPVVSDITANREWILDNENGILLPLFNLDFAVERIANVLAGDYPKVFYDKNIKLLKAKADYVKNMSEIEKIIINKMGTVLK